MKVIFHHELRRKVQFGLPLTLEEQRYCVERLTGEPVPRRKRCDGCNGLGERIVATLGVSPLLPGPPAKSTCRECGGKGYFDV